MKNPLRYTKTELLYDNLVQVDYISGLVVAVLLGAGNWRFFWLALVASLLLGYVTLRTYRRMMRELLSRRTDNAGTK